MRKAQDLRSFVEKASKEFSNLLIDPNFGTEEIDKEFVDKV